MSVPFISEFIGVAKDVYTGMTRPIVSGETQEQKEYYLKYLKPKEPSMSFQVTQQLKENLLRSRGLEINWSDRTVKGYAQSVYEHKIPQTKIFQSPDRIPTDKAIKPIVQDNKMKEYIDAPASGDVTQSAIAPKVSGMFIILGAFIIYLIIK